MESKQPIAPHPKVQLTNVGNIKLQHRSDSPWGEVLISDGRNRVTLISAPPWNTSGSSPTSRLQ